MASGTPSSIPKGVTLDPEVASIPPRTPPGVTLDDTPVSRSIGKTQEPGMIDQLADLSRPPQDWTDVENKAKTVLHTAPYVAAAAGPEGMAAGAAVSGLAGAAEEFGVQSLDKIQGKRQDYDWPAIGFNAGWNAAFSLGGSVVGKGISWLTGAGSADKALSTALTPKSARMAEQGAKDEVTAKTALDSLGTRLGMTEEQSAKMVGAYDEGRQVGDAVFKADRQVQGEFTNRYDKILKPVANDPVDMEPIRDSVTKARQWLRDTGNDGRVRPGILQTLREIENEGVAKPGAAPIKVDTAEGISTRLGETARPSGGAAISSEQSTAARTALSDRLFSRQAVGATEPVTVPTVTTLRGRISQLSELERTKNLNDVEASVVAQTRRALTRSVSGALKVKDPEGAVKLAATDADYAVFKSNFRTFFRALKDKKSLSEVGDAIYDQLGKRPDALRYVLNATDRAGRMDDMRAAFLNKMWRESQVAGGPVTRGEALNAFISKFAPGTKGQGILEQVLGKRPGITDSVGAFSQRLADISHAQEVLKNPATVSRFRRVLEYRMAFGLMAGGAISYSEMRRDPVKGAIEGLAAWGAISGMMAAGKSPALNRAWVEWVTTNPQSSEWIMKGARLLAQAAKDGVAPPTGNNAAPANP